MPSAIIPHRRTLAMQTFAIRWGMENLF